jgi:hypothetical protein
MEEMNSSRDPLYCKNRGSCLCIFAIQSPSIPKVKIEEHTN